MEKKRIMMFVILWASIFVIAQFSTYLYFKDVYEYDSRLQDLQDKLDTDTIQFGTDTSWDKVELFKSIFSFLELIFNPIDDNDTVTIEKKNNTIFVNHSKPENWSKIVGLEAEKFTSPSYTTSNSSEWLNNSSKILFYQDDIAIWSNNPIYESVYCGRQWVIEIEGDVWYVNRFIDGGFSYCPLVINIGMMLE